MVEQAGVFYYLILAQRRVVSRRPELRLLGTVVLGRIVIRSHGVVTDYFSD